MKCKIIILIIALFAWYSGIAQNVTNKGLEFWVGYGHHQYMESNCDGSGTPTNSMNMVIYLSAEEACTVTVTLDSSSVGPFNNSAYEKVYNIPANTVISTEIIPKGINNATQSGTNPNYDARLITDPPPAGTGGEGLFRKKGIHIVSTKPIVAYAHIYGSVASGATMLLPVTAWGHNYTSMNSEQRDASMSYSWMYVIAKENNTMVRITPSVATRLGKPAGQTFDVLLQKGQIYQVVAQSDCATGDGPELTGTTVQSIAGPDGECHTVAVFAGSGRTAGEQTECGTGSGRDNDIQQLFPEQTWGKRYLTVPFSSANSAAGSPTQLQTCVYKVLVRDPTTVVRRNGVVLTGLIKNKYYRYKSNTMDSIIADKPIMVGQFMSMGNGCGTGLGDPEMVYLSPMEQAITRVGFYRNDKESIVINYLTLVVPTKGVGSLRIDGSTTYTTFPHATPGYTVVVKSWPAAKAQCTVTCDSAFTGITYGLGGAESYAYNAGTYLNNLNGIRNLHNSSDTTNGGKNSHAYTCEGSPVELSILLRYQVTKLVWKLSALGFDIMPNLDVTLDPASTAYKGTVTNNGVLYYKYTLPGTYTFNKAGTFYVQVLATSPSLTDYCNNTEEFYMGFEVKAKPVADFTIANTTGCVKDTTFLTGPAATSLSNIQQWLWTFPDGSVSHSKDTSKILSAAGSNTVTLRVVSEEGCVAEVAKQVSLYAVPTASVTAAPASACEGSEITLTPSAAYAGSAVINKYYWNFANGKDSTATAAGVQKVLYNKPGSYEVKLVTGVSKLCVSDTARKVVAIYSKPVIDITYPAGCLPADGVVQFTNNTATPDGQTITAHAWNFGDATATPANPNTATVASPSHVYAANSYQISYRATSSQGCITDTVIKATFSVMPVVNFPALTAVCENAAAYSIAIATVNGSVVTGGTYSGNGVATDGTFTPATAGPGVHTISYSYTAAGGCTVTKTSAIEVYARPLASFTATSSVCLGEQVHIVPAATAGIYSWNWQLGNGTSVVYNNGNAFDVPYASAGNYNVVLATVSSQGCRSLPDTQKVSVHPLPVADFTAPVKICLPGDAAFVNTSTVADNSTLNYVWNFGDGTATVTTKAPSHTYATAGTYAVVLTATSSYGCVSTTTKSVNDFYARPVAAFTIAPEQVCEGTPVTLTDASTPADGIAKRSWNLGDNGPDVAGKVVEKLYNNARTYTVQLTVTNNASCTATVSKQVVVHPQPQIDAGKSFAVQEGTQIQFEATSNSSSFAFSWTPAADLSNASVLQPKLVVNRDATYRLTAVGDYSCTATDSLTVKVLKIVVVPNAFTPNGDNINDKWEIANLSDYADCVVQVFNRYGQKMLEQKGYQVPWNGKINGRDVPVGTYYYVIRLGDGSAPLTGSITIIR
ncbi:gliding motility-associated C-terminal domain-containing protein [Filimonas lacunae]|uniref:Gliding motility-associated C-terminal domain-containing protein n=1 Tax=Filimonas lacunae TaxID=477680 RepID=A0A173MBM5_9BACT|nr:PKD domain-containing protein [Filimonas lacunae]BAV04937.1 Muc19 precursor [Filimonas lacunae]SIT33760.1 gliding motility-associated C-terminal domain-containing protein [Filimonas lacunae]